LSYDQFAALLFQLDPIDIFSFSAATLMIPDNWEAIYSDLEFIVANACASSLDGRKRACTPSDLEELILLSQRIRQEAIGKALTLKDQVQFRIVLSRLAVRGKAYPQQMLQFALDRFRPHDDWMRSKLGFSIQDCTKIASFFCNRFLNGAATIVDNVERELEKPREGFPQFRIPKGSLANVAKIAITLSKKELLKHTRIPSSRLDSLVSRLAQELGTLPKLTNHADFNHLYERPIVKHNDLLLVPLPLVLCQAVSETFYYDVIQQDPAYLAKFEETKGKVSEARCVRFFSQSIPQDFLFPNLILRDKQTEEEIADLIALIDDTLLIVQNKSKHLTLQAQRGNREALHKDIQESIIRAYNQCLKAQTSLLSGRLTTLSNQRWKSIALTLSRIRKMHFIITLEDRYHILLLKDLQPLVDFAGKGYPFIVNHYDLDIMTSLLSTPHEFLDYLEKRLELNREGKTIVLDELDLLGYYLMSNRSFALPTTKGAPNTILVAGYWEHFLRTTGCSELEDRDGDHYSRFIDHMIDRAHECNDLNAFEIITHLSKINREDRKVLGKKAVEKSLLAAQTKTLRYVAVKPSRNNFVVTLLFSPADRSTRQQQLVTLSAAAKYVAKCELCIGVASEPADSKGRSFDYLLLKKIWEEDAELKKIADRMFRSPEVWHGNV